MKAITIVAMTVAIMLVIVVPMISAGGYGGAESYPDGKIFLYAGGSLLDTVSIHSWTVPGTEVAMTVGRNIGPFSPGIGVSVCPDDNGSNRVTHTNLKLGVNMNISRINVNALNLHQNGHGEISDFSLSRVTLSWITKKAESKDAQDETFPIGVVGHNVRFYNPDEDAMVIAPFWGLYTAFGSSKLCVGVNVRNGAIWTALDIGF